MTDQKLVTDAQALLRVLKRVRASHDSLAFRSTGGLRLAIRDTAEDELREKWLTFDVCIVVADDEKPSISAAVKNELDVLEDEELAGFAIIEQYEFRDDDAESLNAVMEFLNTAALWTVCQCGEYLIKDRHAMCYYCELTARQGDDAENVFCPICHETGYPRWMVTTSCCKQKLHKKCKEACIVSDDLRDVESRCPMCRETWQ